MEDLQSLRAQIDDIDRELADLFCRRMAVTYQVGQYKKAKGLPVLDRAREKQVLAAKAALVGEDLRADITTLFETVMAISRRQQQRLMDEPSTHNIVLIGMMGCGKTTVGKLLSAALGRTPVDTDALIEAREGRTVTEIFAADGEEHFRTLELQVSKELSAPNGLVISCGGGLPLQPECMEALRRGGTVFWLNRDPGETYDSLDTSARPLAQNGREDFVARYTQRAPVYEQSAHHIITAPSARAAAEAILSILEKEEPAT